MVVSLLILRFARRRFFAGAERGSRVFQDARESSRGRVRTAEHAPRGPCRGLERRHGLADIVERGVGVQVERPRVAMLTVDETVDDGIILEVDSKTIVNRVLMQGADGSAKDITDMTISQAMEVAREQLLKNVV